jgi:hypothetical protein
MRAHWLALVLMCLPGIAPAQNAQSPRIMLSVLRPGGTLAAQMGMAQPAQPAPGTSASAALVAHLIVTLGMWGINEQAESRARQFAAGLERALAQLDLQRELAAAMHTELQRAGHLAGAVLEEVQDVMDTEQPGLLTRIAERDIYTLNMRFDFDAAYTLQALSSLRLWRKDIVDPVYSAKLEHASPVPAGEGDDRLRWVADEGALLRQALRTAIAETARLFVSQTAQRAAAPNP